MVNMKKKSKLLLYILLFIVSVLWASRLFGYNLISIASGIIAGSTKVPQSVSVDPKDISSAYFAAGCFWCAESSFEKYAGVIDAVSGYAWGSEGAPSYELVSSGTTGHREAVKVVYDASRISYDDLLQIFWRTANPTDAEGQYVDRGFQYTSAIFYSTEQEKKMAEDSKIALAKSGRFQKELVTPILAFTTFYPAEDYHQNYYKVNPVKYNLYTNGSGRKQFLETTWGADLHYELPTERDLKSQLTPLQYQVTQNAATEPAFQNEYWDNKQAGLYVDIIDGTPLYSSLDKYDSGTGWPSFTKPLALENISLHEDNTIFSKRTEVKSASSSAHLGHVFDDGPKDTGGLRYCMNSAAMRFIPLVDLEKEGYREYVKLFSQ